MHIFVHHRLNFWYNYTKHDYKNSLTHNFFGGPAGDWPRTLSYFRTNENAYSKKIMRRKNLLYKLYYEFCSSSLLAFLMERICEGSEVIIWSSVYEAMIFIATCFSPAKNIPSPTSDSKSKYFSSSVRLKVCWSLSIDVGDCLRRTWIEEFVIIGTP